MCVQVPEMLQTMISALEGKDENAAQEALEMFISIAESYPRFLRRQLEQVLGLMLRVRSGARTALCWAASNLQCAVLSGSRQMGWSVVHFAPEDEVWRLH